MRRVLLATGIVGSAVALTGTVLTAVPSLAGSGKTTHTETFIAVSTANHQFDKTHFIGADKDKQNGTVVGYDSVRCTFSNPVATCTVAAAYKGGFLYGKFTQDAKGNLTGKVTGGTGKYQGATGTLSGSAAGKNREKVTVTYST